MELGLLCIIVEWLECSLASLEAKLDSVLTMMDMKLTPAT